jgi:hypothetical protein
MFSFVTAILVISIIDELIVKMLGYQLILAHALETSIVAVGLLISVCSIHQVRKQISCLSNDRLLSYSCELSGFLHHVLVQNSEPAIS